MTKCAILFGMIKISSITALGVIILIVASPPFAVPSNWKDYILMLSGVAVVVLALLIRRELHKVIRLIHGAEEVKPDTYVENRPQ